MSTGFLENDGHSFAIGVKLDDVQQLEFVDLVLLVVRVFDYDFVVLVSLEENDAVVLGGIDQGQLVRRRTAEEACIFILVFFLLDCQNSVAKSQVVQKPLDVFVEVVASVIYAFNRTI